MENTIEPMSPDAADAALAAAQASRQSLADALALPPYFVTSIGAAIAVQIGSAAVGLTRSGAAAWLLVVAGFVVFGLVAAFQLWRFRRINGVWLGGLASRVVFGTRNAASSGYAVAAAAGIWSAFARQWWLVPCCALAGGAAYAVSGRRWWRLYQGDPATHSRGESAVQLAALSAMAAAGLILLITSR